MQYVKHSDDDSVVRYIVHDVLKMDGSTMRYNVHCVKRSVAGDTYLSHSQVRCE